MSRPEAASLGRQVARFSTVGAVNFVLTFAVFTILLKILQVNYLVAIVTAWFVGMVFMYCMSFLWVFHQGTALRFDDRFARFVGIGVASISINVLLLRLFVGYWHSDAFLVQVVLIPVMVTLNFLGSKYVSFRLSRVV